METIGDRLRKLREREGMSQQQLADEMHFGSRSMVSQFESSSRALTIDALLEYSARFKVTADWILRGGETDILKSNDGENMILNVFNNINDPVLRNIAVEQVRLLADI